MQNELSQYYKNVRSEMLAFVPREAKRILDIGCGTGAFGATLKQDRTAEVWGIELNEVAAEKARAVLDHVDVGDVQEVLEHMGENRFDAMVCNDVIEHVPETERLLANIAAHLKPNGTLVASVPNVRFMGNVRHLLIEKDWRYEEEGIRDRTHVRFFTQKSLVRTLANAGFDIVRLEGINGYSEAKFKWLRWLSFGYLADTQHLQFAVVARKR